MKPARLLLIPLTAAALFAAFRYIPLNTIAVPSGILSFFEKKGDQENLPESEENYTSITPTSKLETVLFKIFRELEVAENEIKTAVSEKRNERLITVSIPRGWSHERIADLIRTRNTSTGYSISDAFEGPFSGGFTMEFSPARADKEKVLLKVIRSERYLSNTSKIAIIIENFVFSADAATIDYLTFPEPLTISFAPYTSRSEWASKAATEYNREIIIALPLESRFGKSDTAAIMVHYDDPKINAAIRHMVDKIPGFAGFSAFSASPLLTDSRAVKTLLTDISKRHGYFVFPEDYLSPALRAALSETGVYSGVIARKIRGTSKSDIEEQIRSMMLTAQKSDNMILSAEGSEEFISVLKELHPLFRQNGIRIVPVSQIVTQKNER